MILSRAGYGKTYQIYNLIKSMADNGVSDMILLVPEQVSFESERDVLRLLGAKDAYKTDVLSFTRLCDVFFETYGGRTKRCVDATGKAALMELTLKNLSAELTLYKKQAQFPEFAQYLLSFFEQIKRAAVTSEMLIKQSEKSVGTLKLKLYETALILSDYEQRLNMDFYDPLDDLTKLSEMLSDHRFFKNKIVFIDAFKGFTPQQIKVLDKIIAQAGEVYITLGCDNTVAQDMSVFKNVCATAESIKNIARKNNVKIAPVEYLSDNHRAKNDELKWMERNLFSGECVPYSEPTTAITLCKTKTIYDEVEYIASTIRRLVRTEGYRYRDFAVIARQTAPYMGVIDSTFLRYDMPFFIDGRNSVDNKAIFKLVTCAYNGALRNFNTDDIIAMLKTRLTDVSDDEIAEIDNYCSVWAVKGEEWRIPWTGNPKGLVEHFDEADAEKLQRLNKLREKIVTVLDKLAKGINSSSARDISEAIYKFVIAVKADKNLLKFSKELDEKGFVLLADEERRSYDIFINLLDQLVMALSQTGTDKYKYFELFKSAAALCDIGSLPQGLDEVTVGSAERMRPASPKVTFVVGANEGVFPASLENTGIFTDSEIEDLRKNGIELPNFSEDKAIDENYLAYTALCSPSEKLYVTYQTADAVGAALMPSQIVTDLCEIFPSCTHIDDRISDDELSKIECVSSAAALLAKEYKSKSALYSSLKHYFEANGSDEYSALKNAENLPELKLSPNVAKALYGENIVTSASKTDTFYKCRFSYFCKYGLHLDPLKKAEIDVTNRGTIMHYVLEKTVMQYDSEYILGLDDAQLKQLVTQIVDEYFETIVNFSREKTTRQKFIINSLINVFAQVVRRIFAELSQTEFEIAAVEQEIGGEGDVQSLKIQLDDGSYVILNGKIDRVDIFKKGGTDYIRVLDYKTGAKDVHLSDVIRGQNLQMLVYMIALSKGGTEKFGNNILPAGILYMPAKDVNLSADRFTEDKTVSSKIMSNLKMRGFLLEDKTSVLGMEPSGAGVFIPAKINKKDGEINKNAPIYTLEQFGLLTKRIETLLKQMGETLHSGDISINPTDSVDSNYTACKYCDYKAVCKRDENEKNDVIEKLSKDQIFLKLQGGE
ncbi:MAG: PD-(D/E)XK nuclease family protein [Clostridia bacterium]|nr:PD-(D/E)XK nuclease family protein [Clostridia bacterium]